MCAKFGCGPTVLSKRGGGGTDRQRKLQLYIVDDTVSLSDAPANLPMFSYFRTFSMSLVEIV